MTLTEEQRKKIRRNREIALERKRKSGYQGEIVCAVGGKGNDLSGANKSEREHSHLDLKRRRVETQGEQTIVCNSSNSCDEYDDLEDFERGASDLISKTEAKKMYCLPEGTLDVCKYVEKPNPRHKAWTPMKLYYRAELRQKARKRFESKEGLIEERRRRRENQLKKDMEKVKDIFKN